MKILYLLLVLLFGFHAYVIEQEPQIDIDKREFSEDEGVGLTAEDFANGNKLILEPPDKDAPFPFEDGDVINPDVELTKRYSKRGVVLSKLWPNKKIPYLVTTGFYSNETALIARAISEFQRKTCVRWTPRAGELDYVFFGKSNTCESNVGRVGGCQLIKLKPNKCFHFTTLLHEMMHTIGFVHEHQRNDRDQYVTINTSNLIENDAIGSEVTDIAAGATDVGSYDFQSVMHYNALAFTKNGLPTIVPNDESNVIQMGAGLSEGDVREINHVYECRISYGVDGPIWEDSETTEK